MISCAGTRHADVDKIRVLIVDDHELIRTGLQRFMNAQPDLIVTGSAGDGMTAIEMATNLLPDLVLMDLNLPILDGVLATKEILRRTPQVRVLAFTGHADEAVIEAALQAGACGCASKWEGCEDLLRAVRHTMTVRDNYTRTHAPPCVSKTTGPEGGRLTPPRAASDDDR